MKTTEYHTEHIHDEKIAELPSLADFKLGDLHWDVKYAEYHTDHIHEEKVAEQPSLASPCSWETK